MAKRKSSTGKRKSGRRQKEKKSGSKQIAKEAKGAGVREIGVTPVLAELYKSTIVGRDE